MNHSQPLKGGTKGTKILLTKTEKHLRDLCRECDALDPMEQYALAHEPLPGERLPRLCPCCNFCHDKSTAEREYEEEKAMREKFRADDSKAGRAKYARWQCGRAKEHLNIKAGREGLSVLGQAILAARICVISMWQGSTCRRRRGSGGCSII